VGLVKTQIAVITATLTSISSNEREPKEKGGMGRERGNALQKVWESCMGDICRGVRWFLLIEKVERCIRRSEPSTRIGWE